MSTSGDRGSSRDHASSDTLTEQTLLVPSGASLIPSERIPRQVCLRYFHGRQVAGYRFYLGSVVLALSALALLACQAATRIGSARSRQVTGVKGGVLLSSKGGSLNGSHSVLQNMTILSTAGNVTIDGNERNSSFAVQPRELGDFGDLSISWTDNVFARAAHEIAAHSSGKPSPVGVVMQELQLRRAMVIHAQMVSEERQQAQLEAERKARVAAMETISRAQKKKQEEEKEERKSDKVKCSGEEEYCGDSKCCDGYLQCYKKNDFWSICNSSCEPGPHIFDNNESWSCEVLGHRKVPPTPTLRCALPETDCSVSQCCVVAGHQCYQKNVYWAQCMDTCEPQEDGRRDNWTCQALGHRTPFPSAHPLQFHVHKPFSLNNVSKFEECGSIEFAVDFNATVLDTLYDVGSEHMCCAACSAYPQCGAWTWGRKKNTEWVSNVCWLKVLAEGQTAQRMQNVDVSSGIPSQQVRKQGVIPPAASSVKHVLDGVVPKTLKNPAPRIVPSFDKHGEAIYGQCPGNIVVDGVGEIALVSTDGAEGRVEALEGNAVVVHLGGRSYFASSCTSGSYNQDTYIGLKLLNKTLRWVSDLSGSGCGCNAAMYLVSMPQNNQVGTCDDYYCDAMAVCGVKCHEVDLQEGNQYAFLATLHDYNATADVADTEGPCRGFGGSFMTPPRRDWSADEYGPGSQCIDTTRPFEVAVSFPVDPNTGVLQAVETRLSQDGCSVEARVDEYLPHDRMGGMESISGALDKGMTPVMSFWKSSDMLWLDGLSVDGLGPCATDNQACPDHVRFFDFSVEPIRPPHTGAARSGRPAPVYAAHAHSDGKREVFGCVLEDWSDWSSCASDASGTTRKQTRSRNVKQEPTYDWGDCRGGLESQQCDTTVQVVEF